MSHPLKSALEEAWTQAWGQGSTSRLEQLVSPAYERVSERTGAIRSLSSVEDEIAMVRAAFPDLSTEVTGVIVDGASAAIFWETTGTHTGTLLGVPPINRRVHTRGSNLLTLDDDGRIVRDVVTWDSSEILAALGITALEDTPFVGSETTEDVLAGDADPELMKGFNRQFVTGVTVVTTIDGHTPRGLAVNAYCSVSLEPALVLVCIQKSSSTYPSLFASDHLGINILGNDQKDVVSTFATKLPDKFEHVGWHSAPSGSPLIDGSAAALEGEIRQRFQARTHTIFICRVRHAEVSDAAPMVYKAGTFFDGEDLRAL